MTGPEAIANDPKRAAMRNTLSEAVAYQQLPRIRRLASDPWRAVSAEFHRSLPWRQRRLTTVRLFTGQDLTIAVHGPVGPLKYGFWDPDLTDALLALIQPGAVVADVGAHYGYYSVLVSELVGPSGLVHAFEPTPQSFQVLEQNSRRFANIRANNVAVYSREAHLELLDFGSERSGLNTLTGSPRSSGLDADRGQAIVVRATTLDNYFESVGVWPDFVKIDAESSEMHVLKGMSRILTQDSPLMLIEVGDFDNEAARSVELIRYVEAFGYSPFDWAAGRLRPHSLRALYGAGDDPRIQPARTHHRAWHAAVGPPLERTSTYVDL
jgi:FkbM family methyltransferase